MYSHSEQNGWGRAALNLKIDLISNSLSELSIIYGGPTVNIRAARLK